MALSSGLEASGGLPALQALYDTALHPYLAAQDAPVLAARRNRWLVLIGGLALAAAVLAWALPRDTESLFFPLVGAGIGALAIGYFWLSTDLLADEVRHDLMRRIAAWLGLHYEPRAEGFDLRRFALLGLANYDKDRRSDRLFGEVDGLAVDMMAARLADEETSGVGSDRKTRTIERFSGLLLCLADPSGRSPSFRLVPPASATSAGKLRDVSIVRTLPAGTPDLSFDEMDAMLAAGPEAAPPTPTGDAAFDARFELHVLPQDAPAALARLNDALRAALLEVAACFGGGAVSVGFDGQHVLMAFITAQRFEIGALRPPMAQFPRVQHLAEQMAVLPAIAARLRPALA